MEEKKTMSQPVTSNHLNEKTINGFNAITNFVSALADMFKRDKPLALYNRLLVKLPLHEVQLVKKHVRIFTNYLTAHKKELLAQKLVFQDGDIIKYNERVYINLPYFVKNCDKDTLGVIKNHLLTIASILTKDNDMLQSLEKLNILNVDTSTKEGAFMGNIMNNITGALGNMGAEGGGDGSNFDFGTLATTLMSNDVLSDAFGQLKDGMQSGEMNPKALLGGFKNIVGSLMSQIDKINFDDEPTLPNVPNSPNVITTSDTKDANFAGAEPKNE